MSVGAHALSVEPAGLTLDGWNSGALTTMKTSKHATTITFDVKEARVIPELEVQCLSVDHRHVSMHQTGRYIDPTCHGALNVQH